MNLSLRTILVSLISAGVFGGCAMLPRAANQADVPTVADIHVNPQAAIGNNGEDVMDIEAQFEDVFINKPLHKSDPLPAKMVSGLSFTDGSILDALRIVLKGAGISLAFHNSANNNQPIYGAVTAYDIGGPLSEVLENLSESAGFYYHYRGGVLHVYPDEQYVVNLPPIINDDVFAGMANTITKLGGFDTYLDRQGRALTFRANRTAMRAIQGYLEHIRETRSVIVYDTYVYQVELSDINQTGIDWSKLALTLPSVAGGSLGVTASSLASGGAALTSAEGIGFNAVYESSRLSVNGLFTFLRSQGNVKTIAQPKLAILSGAIGTFKVGSVTNYVSKVGTNSNTTLNQTTVETDKVLSGLDLGISGDVHDGTIYTRINMSLTDLIRFNSFKALDTELKLPQTTNRELKTIIRARAGDMVLLGGINNTRGADDIAGLPGKKDSLSMLTKSATESTRSELVIVLKPKLISFMPKQKLVEKQINQAIAAQPILQVQTSPDDVRRVVVTPKEVRND